MVSRVRAIPDRRRTLGVLVLAAAVMAAGCGAEEEGAAAYPGSPEIVLGTGYFSFAPIVDQEAVSVVSGPQGGYHIWGAVRGRYLNPEEVMLQFTLTLIESEELAQTIRVVVDLGSAEPPPGSGEAAPADAGDGWGDSTGIRLFVDPAEVAGRALRIEVEATDQDGRAARDVAVVVPELCEADCP
jgi:hypothetical protein